MKTAKPVGKEDDLRMPAADFDQIMGQVMGSDAQPGVTVAKVYTRDEIKDAIRQVLRDAPRRKARPEERVFTTAYQVLSFLDADMRDQLVSAAGPSGSRAGWYHSAAKAVAKMLVEMSQAGEVEIVVLDTRRVSLDLEGQGKIEPGDKYGCGLYRLRKE